MKSRIFLLYFLLLFLFIGCYDNEGNDNYHFLNTIEVKPFGGESTPWAAYGDTIRYSPVLRFESGNGEGLTLTYEWTFAGRPIGNQLNLEWIVDTVATGSVILRVTDQATGLVYSNETSLRIQSPYKSKGWIVLAEKEGHSSLSFVREIITDYEMDEETEAIYYILDNQAFPDVYQKVNGEVLGTHPVCVTEHFTTVAPGALLVVQEGTPGSVDLDGNTLMRDIYLYESFEKQQYPKDFTPINATCMHWLDVIENKDGRLFTRLKYSDKLFNTGYFITEPVMAEKDEVRGHLLDCDWEMSGYTLVHDRGTEEHPCNRLASLYDFRDFWGVNFAGRATILPEADGGWPAGFVPLNNLGANELVCLRGRAKYTTGYYFMILKTPEGKYIQQTFTVQRSGEKLYYIDRDFTVEEMPTGFDYSNSLLYVLTTEPYLVIVQGSEMYYYNYQSRKDGVEPYWHFESPVKSMTEGIGGLPQLGCALENGQFVILDVDGMKNKPERMRLYWRTQPDVNLGKPVQVIYKTSGSL